MLSASEEGAVAGTARIALDSVGVEGLRGSDGRLNFGDSLAEVSDVISSALGEPAVHSVNDECGAGPMEFVSWAGLTLNGLSGRFAGWLLSDGAQSRRLVAAPGVAIGDSRAQLEELLQVEIDSESTLGVEFHTTIRASAAGEGVELPGPSGLLSGNGSGAKVEALFSGVTCFFR